MSDRSQYPIKRKKRQKNSNIGMVEEAVLREIDRLGRRRTTARFVFYRLVDQQIIPKDTKSGKKPIAYVHEALTHLRWAGVIPMGQIVDEGRDTIPNFGYADLLEAALERVGFARFNPWGDTSPPQIWVEDVGTASLLRSITYRYCVPAIPMSGQASTGLVYEAAQNVVSGHRIFYLGDWDRGGLRIQKSAVERIGALGAAWSEAVKILESPYSDSFYPEEMMPSDVMWRLGRGREESGFWPLDLEVERLAITPEQAAPLDRFVKQKTYADGTTMEVIELQALDQIEIEQMVIDALDAELADRELDTIETADEETERQREDLAEFFDSREVEDD